MSHLISWEELNKKEIVEPDFLLDPYIVREGITLLYAKTSVGKSWGIDTPILMYDGSIKMVQDIELNDLVMGPDSKPRKVLHLHSGSEPLYKIEPEYGESYICNESHLLYLHRSWKTIHYEIPSINFRCDSYTPIEDIKIVSVKEYLSWGKDRKRQVKLVSTGVDFPDAYQEISPYFLGLLLGDGSFRGTLNLTTVDEEIKNETYKQASYWSAEIRPKQKAKSPTCFSYYFKDYGALKAAISRLGLWGTTSGTKFIPDNYKRASALQRMEILAGILDTDGTSTSCGYDLISKSSQLIDDTMFIARSLGFKCKKTVCKKGCQGGFVGTYYRLYIGGDVWRIPVRLARKKVEERPLRKNPHHSGFKITPVGEGEFYGFTLDGDHLHLMGDFTIAHNSPVSWAMAKSIGDGTHFFGLPSKEGRVLYIELDTPELAIAPRLRHLTASPNVWFLFSKPLGIPNPANEELAALKEARDEVNPDVVFINTLQKAHDLDGNAAQTVKLVYTFFQKLFPKAALVFIHHMRKDVRDPKANQHTEQGFSGSQAWANDAQIAVNLEKYRSEKENIRMFHRKSQVTALMKPLPLLLGDDGATLTSPLFDELFKVYEFMHENSDLKGSHMDSALMGILKCSMSTARKRRLLIEEGLFPGSRNFLLKDAKDKAEEEEDE